MAIISHDYKSLDQLSEQITKDGMNPLYGEIDMYRRIYDDCQKSEYTWHFWHDLRLPIPVNGQSQIQIDFFLVCPKGAVIIEVKGGGISITHGQYYFTQGMSTLMSRSPFEQAQDYMYALINNGIVNTREIFLDTICAFPHTEMSRTNNDPALDRGYKLWSKIQQADTTVSFADFCLGVLEEDKQRKRLYRPNLTEREMCILVNKLVPSIASHYKPSEESFQETVEWLRVQNLDIYKALAKNTRLIMEGGPGTGKTTIAKAFIRRHKNMHGTYLCWNKLLAAKIHSELQKAGLVNCEVHQFQSFLHGLDPAIEFGDFNSKHVDLTQHIKQRLQVYRARAGFVPYDYIIIDEAQDMFDKGAACVLSSLTSITANGLESGRFLVFFDTEQGYGKDFRQLDEYAEEISHYGAHYVLSENKRVPTNKEIVEFANRLLGERRQDPSKLIEELESLNLQTIKVTHVGGAKELIRHVRAIHQQMEEDSAYEDYVVLASSSIGKLPTGGAQNLYDRLADMEQVKELTPQNLCIPSKEVALTTALKYKGLERKHVVLLFENDKLDAYELYVGMSRAICDLEIVLI